MTIREKDLLLFRIEYSLNSSYQANPPSLEWYYLTDRLCIQFITFLEEE